MRDTLLKIGDIIQTFFMNKKYHGIVTHISGDYCYVELFDGPHDIRLLPLHYSSITKVS